MFRMLRISLSVLKSLRRSKVNFATELTRLQLRVWPSDTDITYVNQANYLLFCEYARWDFIFRSQLIKLMRSKGCLPITAAESIRIVKPLKCWQKCTVTTKICYWNEKWVFIEHLILKDENIVAIVLVKGIFRGKNGVVPATEIMSALGAPLDGGTPPDYFNQWYKCEEKMFRSFKSTALIGKPVI